MEALWAPPSLTKAAPRNGYCVFCRRSARHAARPCLFLTQKRGSEWLPRAVVLRAAFCFPVSIDVILRV